MGTIRVVKKNGRGQPLGTYYQARCAACGERLSDFDFSPEEARAIAAAERHSCHPNQDEPNG